MPFPQELLRRVSSRPPPLCRRRFRITWELRKAVLSREFSMLDQLAPGYSIAPNAAASRWHSLAEDVLRGGEVSRAEALAILQSPDEELLDLLAAAFKIRQRHFGRQVQLYFLMNAKSGL